MLKNCDNCNRVFAHPTRSLCDECYKEAQEAFGKVKTYLQENPGSTVAEVAQATEVDVDTIYEYIRQGRLTVVPKDAALRCDICGTTIEVGRVCDRCRAGLQKGLRKEPTPRERPQSADGSRVHYLDGLKERRG